MIRVNLFYTICTLLFLFPNTSIKAQGFWGVTSSGGDYDEGTIFYTDSNGDSQTIKHSFYKVQGRTPSYSKLCEASNGKLYGMTERGGSNDYGILFEYNQANDEYTVKVVFDGTNGSYPKGGLFEASNGKLYGMTYSGGTNDLGILFEYNISANTLTKRLDFDGTANGQYPYGTLMEAGNGKLYGMTQRGGTNSSGVLFEFDQSTNTYTKKYDFGGINGYYPYGDLLESSNGKLYGLTSFGGASIRGVLFEYAYSTNTFTKKIDFTIANGQMPTGSLIEAADGNIYGMTQRGGSSGKGVIFKYIPGTTGFSGLYHFSGVGTGEYPYGSLVEGSNGLLYGMTRQGGTIGVGVLFEYTTATNTLAKKLNFNFLNGQYPIGSLEISSNGHIYGMTNQGGSVGSGVIFKYDYINDVYTKQVDFGKSVYGSNPQANVIEASNGRLYGLTYDGGLSNSGVLFEFNPTTNTYSVVFNFSSSTTGKYPYGNLIEATNSKLYGLTSGGGANNMGALFEYDISTNTFTKKIDFDFSNTGSSPRGDLLQASNGKFYGMTYSGGANNKGVLFEYDLSLNTCTKKIDFDGADKGQNPSGSLVEDNNGKLYGLVGNGGVNSNGVLFEFDIDTETFIKKIDFDGTNKGASPSGSLLKANNGKFYGTTSNGGANSKGVLFEYIPSTNAFVKLLDFDGTDKGSLPIGGLMQANNNMLYGMTYSGGANDKGVVFQYDYSSSTFTKKLDFNSTNGEAPVYSNLIETSNSAYTWDGSESNDWAIKENWSADTKPKTTNSIIIPTGLVNYPTISYPAYCNNITLKSDATGEASLLRQDRLTVNGTATVERYVLGYSTASNGWHLLSSPINTYAINGTDFTPLSGTDDFYRWEETTYSWLNYYGGSFGTTEFENGAGYLVAYNTGEIKSFSGDLNDGTVIQSLSFSGGAEDGWNLLGNPYSSAIDWDLLTKTFNIHGSVYIVNPADGSYFSWNGGTGDISNGEIPINQGFFVKANAVGQVITMKVVDQVHSNTDFYKSSKAVNETLKVSLKGENSNNNTYIQFKEDATVDFDHQCDAYKLFGFGEIAQVYTETEETQYSINCLSYSTETISVPLAIRVLANEALEFNFSGIDSFDASIKIDLEDLKTGTITNIRTNPVYTFQATTTDEANRFILHFNGVTAVENIEEVQAPLVYSFNNAIYIKANKLKEADFFIYNINAQLVGQEQLKGEDLKRLDLELSTGVYMVSVQSANSIWNQKVYIK